MATQKPKPQSLHYFHFPSSNKRLLLILLASAIFILAAAGCYRAKKTFSLLKQETYLTKKNFERLQHVVFELEAKKNTRISALEQALERSEAKFLHQEEQIRSLEPIFAQWSIHTGMREVNLLQEFHVQKDMYIQAQQKIRSYEQQLVSLTQEMKYYKEQNQLIRQEQAKIRAEHQELLNQRSQVSQEQLLKEPLETRLSQLANADYEFEQKLKDLQRAVESSAKIGELKALEVYYDDKLENLSRAIQKSNNNNFKNSSDTAQYKQLKQDLIKLAEEEEGIKAAFNKFSEFQKDNEERLKALENQDNLNVVRARPVDAPVQSPHELLKEAVENYNRLSKSGGNKKELKEAKKQIKQLHRQINQQSEETSQKIQQDATEQNKPQGTQKEQVRIPEGEPFDRELGNDIANLINAFVDSYQDL